MPSYREGPIILTRRLQPGQAAGPIQAIASPPNLTTLLLHLLLSCLGCLPEGGSRYAAVPSHGTIATAPVRVAPVAELTLPDSPHRDFQRPPRPEKALTEVETEEEDGTGEPGLLDPLHTALASLRAGRSLPPSRSRGGYAPPSDRSEYLRC